LPRLDRGRVNDRAARLHAGSGRLRQEEGRVDVGAEGFVPFFGRDVSDVAVGSLECRVVYEDVDATKFVDGALYQILAMFLGLNVARNDKSLAAGFLDPLRGVAGVVVLVEIGNDDVGAFSGKSNSDGLANPGVGSGDEGDFACQLAVTL
jgi:hypothetical protein